MVTASMLIGIDLGTTNSLVSVYENGKARLVKNALGHVITPSVVGVDDDDKILVGQPAKDRLQTHPHKTIAAFKRSMGSDQTINIGSFQLNPQELSSFLIKQLKEDVEAELGQPVTEAIITVPAYFNDTQRKLTKLAGQLAGLNVERLLNEPTAAALAYGVHENKDTFMLVFDLGGGTFDVSILEMFDGIMEIRSCAGDNRLGGEDFTALIAADFTQHLISEHAISEEQLMQCYGAKILAESERAKQSLSNSHEHTLQLEIESKNVCFEYTRSAFEKRAEPLLNRLMLPIKRAISDSKISVSELESVLLVGGATRMPMINKLVAKMFGKLPLREVNPDEVVALGAGYQAALKSQNKDVDDIVLTDVCPFTLGLEVVTDIDGHMVGGVFSPIIERNVTVPTSRADRFFTTTDDQEHVSINVYQGESRHTRNNIHLGLLDIKVPKSAAGEQAIDVRFSYDINGLLEVEANILSTNETHRLLITNNHTLSQEDIDASLEKLSSMKIHPRENTSNISFLARANRLYEQHLGEERERIGHIIDYFSSALEKGNDIDDIRVKLEQDLNQYEL